MSVLGGALAARELEPLLGRVDAHDPFRAGEPAARDGAETDEPGAEHDARRAGLDLAVFTAAPSPVESPQAKTHERSSAASGEIFASAISGIAVYSAKVDVPMKCRMGSPSRERRVVPSGRSPWFCCSRIARQRLVRGSRQCTHSRHCGEKSVTT